MKENCYHIDNDNCKDCQFAVSYEGACGQLLEIREATNLLWNMYGECSKRDKPGLELAIFALMERKLKIEKEFYS